MMKPMLRNPSGAAPDLGPMAKGPGGPLKPSPIDAGRMSSNPNRPRLDPATGEYVTPDMTAPLWGYSDPPMPGFPGLPPPRMGGGPVGEAMRGQPGMSPVQRQALLALLQRGGQ